MVNPQKQMLSPAGRLRIEEPLRIEDAKPLLTIAIPTYNRARYLKELLSVLFDQMISEPRVELIISDNASPDETPNVVAEFEQRGLRLRSIRNEVNIGADANFLQCFEQARGRYVWIFGDDDVIVSGGIARVLSYLDNNDFDLVYLDTYPHHDSGNSPKMEWRGHVTELEDARQFVSRVHVFFTFISGNILNKEHIQANEFRPFSELLGSNLIQLGWTYAALNGFKRGLHIQEKLVGARVNNAGGYKLLEVFGPTLKMVTNKRLHSEDLAQIIFNGALQRFWPGMMLQYKRSATVFTQEEKPSKILASVFKDNFRYWTFVFPIMILPALPATGWLLLVRAINRIDRAFGFVLLQFGR
jgi:abequosyltransferase